MDTEPGKVHQFEKTVLSRNDSKTQKLDFRNGPDYQQIKEPTTNY